MTDILLRDYTPDDWNAVCQIHDAARLQELASGGVDPRAFKPMAEAAEEDEFFASKTVVACCADVVVGFVSWNCDYVTWLYVAPSAQGAGIGRKLLHHALQIIGPEAWTNMIAGNERAQRLYESAGMEVVWTRESDIEGYPCRAMRLALPTSRMRDPAARRRQPSEAGGTWPAPYNPPLAMRIPSQITIVESSFFFDGGTVVLRAVSAEGDECSIQLNQRVFAEFYSHPGRLFFDQVLVEVRSPEETQIVQLLKSARIEHRPKERPRSSEPPISKNALILSDDIRLFLESTPQDNLRRFRDEMVAFVESDEYVRIATYGLP